MSWEKWIEALEYLSEREKQMQDVPGAEHDVMSNPGSGVSKTRIGTFGRVRDSGGGGQDMGGGEGSGDQRGGEN